MTEKQKAEQEQQERLEQALALYDALSPELRRQFIQIMRDMVTEQNREQAIQTAQPFGSEGGNEHGQE